tara:strand:- start:1644 stop:2438 length:795 start_codon:yes stop_codon:yes gene_type:complete
MQELFLQLERKLESLILTNKLLAVKAEFEAEGTRIDELAALSDLCCKNDIPLTLKIGGPFAQRDIYEAFQLGASNIMAPMVESSFAVFSSSEIFNKNLPAFKGLKNNTSLFINIESELAIKNFESILQTIAINKLPVKCVVVGRSDLSASLNIDDVNSDRVFEIVKYILDKSKPFSLPVAIGGNLTKNSYQFIRRLSDEGLFAFESRKCTYKVYNDINEKEFTELINIGLDFELSWLRYRQAIYANRSDEENSRIKLLNSRISI